MKSKYWFISPEYYDKIDEILNSNINDVIIRSMKQRCTKGGYICWNDDKEEWGYMLLTYKKYEKNHYTLQPSSEWLDNHDYKYMGEISRRSKLNKINERN